MQCVCLEKKEKAKPTKPEKKGKEQEEKKEKTPEFEVKCVAVIGTTQWTPDKTTLATFCEKSKFVECPRLEKYLQYVDGLKTIKVKSI